MSGTYWLDALGLLNTWTAFAGSLGPPDNILLTVQAYNAGDELRRTVADIEYTLMVETDRVHRPPFAVWADISVQACIWVDPTGVASSGNVPYPYLPTVAPFPVWEGQLYGNVTFYDDGLHSGWVVQFRPLHQIDVAAERGWVGPGTMSTWLHVFPFPNSTWNAVGAQQFYRMNYGIHQLFEIP